MKFPFRGGTKYPEKNRLNPKPETPKPEILDPEPVNPKSLYRNLIDPF